METLLAVIKDLLAFILNRQSESSSIVEPKNPELLLSAPEEPTLLEEKQPKSHFDSVQPEAALGAQEEKAFVVVDKTNVFYRPVFSYDGVIKRLSYADPVLVSGYEGRFARISARGSYGWVLKDDLTSKYSDISPEFQTGETYSSNHPDTKKLRKLIHDEFFATEMYLPLQAVEFISFKIAHDGHVISWPDVRPRMPGTWQNILKGRMGVRIGVTPKTAGIIEYIKPDGTGWVGYTKAVHVDESIVIQGVGRLIEGEYREEVFTKEEWHEWRPVWISIT